MILLLFQTEVYREYVYDGEKSSMLEFPEIAEHSIIIDSESKRYSMCGVRIGCLVTRSKTLHDAAMKFAQARLSPSAYWSDFSNPQLMIMMQNTFNLFAKNIPNAEIFGRIIKRKFLV